MEWHEFAGDASNVRRRRRWPWVLVAAVVVAGVIAGYASVTISEVRWLEEHAAFRRDEMENVVMALRAVNSCDYCSDNSPVRERLDDATFGAVRELELLRLRMDDRKMPSFAARRLRRALTELIAADVQWLNDITSHNGARLVARESNFDAELEAILRRWRLDPEHPET